MKAIANCVPATVSGLSGTVRAGMGANGQRKSSKQAGLLGSVRVVRESISSLTHARTRAKRRAEAVFIYSLRTLKKTGQAGQRKEVIGIAKESLSGFAYKARTATGKPGQELSR